MHIALPPSRSVLFCWPHSAALTTFCCKNLRSVYDSATASVLHQCMTVRLLVYCLHRTCLMLSCHLLVQTIWVTSRSGTIVNLHGGGCASCVWWWAFFLVSKQTSHPVACAGPTLVKTNWCLQLYKLGSVLPHTNAWFWSPREVLFKYVTLHSSEFHYFDSNLFF